MPNLAAIRAIAQKHGISVIEDAAEAIGSESQGRKAGSFGDTGVFSFHGSKTLTTGEGGMLVTDRDDVRARVLFLRDHGRPPGDRYFHNTEVAWKYKMSSMQAALGLAQLERIDELIGRKREIFSWYRAALGDHPGITLNSEAPETKNTYWMVTAILSPEYDIGKKELMELLGAKGVESRPFFHPLSSIPAYEKLPQAALARERNFVSYSLTPYGVNLPSALNLTEEKVHYVCKTLETLLENNSGGILRSPG
jgi:perosamine synthetase